MVGPINLNCLRIAEGVRALLPVKWRKYSVVFVRGRLKVNSCATEATLAYWVMRRWPKNCLLHFISMQLSRYFWVISSWKSYVLKLGSNLKTRGGRSNIWKEMLLSCVRIEQAEVFRVSDQDASLVPSFWGFLEQTKWKGTPRVDSMKGLHTVSLLPGNVLGFPRSWRTL